jgi:hypothetical protein
VVVVEKPNPFQEKSQQAISLKAMGRLIAKPISQLVSSAILLGGWTLVVVGFVGVFPKPEPCSLCRHKRAEYFRLFQANYASQLGGLAALL